jgi:hypothetical protein
MQAQQIIEPCFAAAIAVCASAVRAPVAGWLDQPQVQARLLWDVLQQQARVTWHAAVIDLQHPVAVVPVSLEALQDRIGTACTQS